MELFHCACSESWTFMDQKEPGLCGQENSNQNTVGAGREGKRSRVFFLVQHSVHFLVYLLYCCRESVASEQQHNQDVRRIYKTEYEFSKSSLFTRMCSSRKYPYSLHRRDWNFQRGGPGGGVLEKIPSVGEVWIFSGITQCIAFNQRALSLRTGSQRGRKKIRRAKQVGVRALWLREWSEWDAGEPVDIVFNVPFCPLVISLFHICQGGH